MSRYRLLNDTAYLAIGLTWAGICVALGGGVTLALGHPQDGIATAAWGVAAALLGLALLTTTRWLERRDG